MLRSLRSWLANRSRLALIVGVLGAAAIALTTTSTLGGFTASITNTGDQANAGSLLMKEDVTPTGGTTTTCLSTASATAITGNANNACGANKFGAITNGVPGATSNSTVVVTNQGSVTANTFTMYAGGCTATPTAGVGAAATNVGSDTAGFCGKIDITIEDDTTAGSPKCVYPVSAAACAAPTSAKTLTTLTTDYPSATPVAFTGTVAAGAARTYKFTILFDSTMTNADQAMAATQPITFTFNS